MNVLDTQESAFVAGLNSEPNNWELRSIYADWLWDAGREDESKLQQWMVKWKRSPSHNASGYLMVDNKTNPTDRSWDWWLIGTYKGQDYLHGEVFCNLIAYVGHENLDYREYYNREDAEADLLQALKKLGEL